jgi:hypothetical protein
MPNFVLLDVSRPEIADLLVAMLQAREAVGYRSWSHSQEPTGEAWWADVLADLRARKRERRTDLAVKQAFYRLADEKDETMLVACSKCDWRAAFSRDDLIAAHGADYAMPNLLNHLAAPSCSRLASNWDRCGVHYVEPIEGQRGYFLGRVSANAGYRALRWMLRQSSSAVATSREGHRQPRSDRAVRDRRWGREPRGFRFQKKPVFTVGSLGQ